MSPRMAAAVLSIFVCCLTVGAADDPQVGVWKLNVEQSEVNPPPRMRTVTIVPFGNDGIKLHTEEILHDGKRRTLDFSAQYDGKPYPRAETGPGAVRGETVALKRLDANRVERTVYHEGKKEIEIWEIFKDGKNRRVFERQP